MTQSIAAKPTIQALLFDSGIDTGKADVDLADANYALPALDWLLNDFSRAFTEFRNKMIGLYANGESDCDDFAECAVFFAHYLHRHTPNRPAECALAFGEFWYQPSPATSHAINVVVCRVDDVLRLVFYEPQTAQQVHLTQKEISSCWYVRL